MEDKKDVFQELKQVFSDILDNRLNVIEEKINNL